MSRLISNSRGIGLIEVIISIFLVTVGVLAILSMQPSAWRLVGKSDYLGRGAGILHRELESREACIMNPCNTVATGTATAPPILISGLGAAASGDAQYTVTTTITPVAGVTNAWTVTATVTWPDQQIHGYRNLTESIVVAQQQRSRFAFPQDGAGTCTGNGNCTLP
jgi:Tfp pilus assembly protein PilV